jgi:hypothetical protein
MFAGQGSVDTQLRFTCRFHGKTLRLQIAPQIRFDNSLSNR